MSAADFSVVAIVVPNPLYDNSRNARVVNETIGFSLESENGIQTLSTTNPSGYDLIQGLLYVPNISNDSGCADLTQGIVPSNVTTLTSFFPSENYPLVAIAPWTSTACTEAYFAAMRADAVRGAFVYQPDRGDVSTLPNTSDRSWSLDDNRTWRKDNQFPIYAIQSSLGAQLMTKLGQYSGNMSQVPYGDELVNVYDPHDSVRLYARVDLSQSSGIPSLWVFLIIVLAILLAIVLSTSVIMNLVQRRQRHILQRRVQNGEVDLESLGIKRLNVPQEELDKMPQYLYTAKAETAAATSLPPGTSVREVPFSQPTCPICLDDFIHNESTVRELPCNHIFHPECIDPFLRDNSSLCPMCKKSALPAGYCPVKVTNLMVRRERLVRRMRDRRRANGQAAFQRSQRATRPQPALSWVQRRLRLPSAPPPAYGSATGAHGTDVEMGSASVARSRRDTEAPPPEIASQGTAARRAWRRERFARQQARNYDEQAETARRADEGRPLWRRVLGRVLPAVE